MQQELVRWQSFETDGWMLCLHFPNRACFFWVYFGDQKDWTAIVSNCINFFSLIQIGIRFIIHLSLGFEYGLVTKD